MNLSTEYMAHCSPASRRRVALAVWAASLLMFVLLGVWNVNADRHEAENRLRSEAGRTATQLAALLSLPAWEMDELAARTIVMAAMENETIYAIKVQAKQGMLEGQRRNYQWEPVPWDDEIEENAVLGKSPLKMEGRPVGTVEVYFSPRLADEELAQKARREVVRFCFSGAFSTVALLALLWFWGDMARLWAAVAASAFKKDVPPSGPEGDAAARGSATTRSDAAGQEVAAASDSSASHVSASSPEPAPFPSSLREDLAAGAVVSPELGRAFLLRRPEAWRVTAGLFGQTFAHAPLLLLRLFEEGDAENLCRLGHILERAAPCVGAERLAAAAVAMQTALNDPDGESAAVAVEECVLALKEVLASLNGMPPQADAEPTADRAGE